MHLNIINFHDNKFDIYIIHFERNKLNPWYVTSFINSRTGQSMGFLGKSRCHATTYYLNERSKMLRRVVANCNTTDMSCNEDCVEQLKIHAEHPCHDKSVLGLYTFVTKYLFSEEDRPKAAFTAKMAEKCSKQLMKKKNRGPPKKVNVNVCVSSASLAMPAFSLSLIVAFLISMKNISC